VHSLVLLAPQLAADGIGAMASLPRPLAALGVEVLRAKALRSMACRMAFADPR
jgi:hypothetical protein